MTVACHFSQLNIEFNQNALFSPLSGTLQCQQNALIGNNGKGKSVLMRLLAQQMIPTTGHINWMMPFIHVEQLTRLEGNSIADALGVSALVDAFTRVDTGNATMEDFELLEDKWHLPAEWQSLLDSAKLPIMVDEPINHLSGGERTRLALCRAFLHKNHFLLLDEPDNHLDHEGRQWLSNKLAEHKAGSLVITHSRSLLGQMQTIFELTDKGLHEYGGILRFMSSKNSLPWPRLKPKQSDSITKSAKKNVNSTSRYKKRNSVVNKVRRFVIAVPNLCCYWI